MGYGMKRGAKPKFNELGSSPVKGKGDNLKRIMSERKALAKKTGTFYAPGAEPNLPKGSNYPKGFNYKGSSASTTPGYASTKMARDAVAKAKAIKAHDAAINKLATDPKTANLPKKQFDKLLDKTSKSFTKQKDPTTKHKASFDKFQSQKQKGKQFVKDVLKKGGKIASKTARGSNILALLLGSTTTSKADQLKVEKSEREQMRDILTRHNLKGGRK